MANLIRIKRTTGISPPTTSASEFGMLSYADSSSDSTKETLYITKSDGSITEVGGQGYFFKLDETTNIVLQDYLMGVAATGSGESRAIRFKTEGSSSTYDMSIKTDGTDLVVYDLTNTTTQFTVRSDDGSGTYGVNSKYGYSLDGTIVIDKKSGQVITLTNVDKITNTGTDNGLDIDVGTGGIDALATGGVISISTTGAGKDINLDAQSGSVLIDGGEDTADAVKITASNTTGSATLHLDSQGSGNNAILVSSSGGIDVNSTKRVTINTTTASEDIALDAEAASVFIDGGEGVADAVRITASNAAGGIDVDAGTAGIDIKSTGGVVNVTNTGAGKDINIDSTQGSVLVDGGEATADAVKITASGTGATTSLHLNSAGTGNSAVDIDSAGGIDIDAGGQVTLDAANTITVSNSGAAKDITIDSAAGSVNIDGGEAAANAVYINASNAAGGIDIDAGTGGLDVDIVGNINVDSSTGDVNVRNAGAGKNITVDSAAGSVLVDGGEIAANAVKVTASGSGAATTLHINSAGTGTSAVDIDSAGGIDVDAVDTITINNSGAAKDITIDSAAGSVNIEGGQAAADAVRINTSAIAGGIDIDAGTGGIAVDSTGSISIDADASSNFNTSVGNITLDAEAGIVNIDGNSGVNIDSAHGALSLQAKNSSDITTTVGNITVNGKTGVNIQESGVTVLSVTDDRDISLPQTGGSKTNPDLHVAGYAKFTDQVQIDDLNINGSTILTDLVNGDINITSNGSGSVNINRANIDDGTIDSVVFANNTITNNNLVYSTGDLSVNITPTATATAGSASVTFASAHGLTAGDAIQLPSGAGGSNEVFTVASVTDSTHITTDSALTGAISGVTAQVDPNLFVAMTGDSQARFTVDSSGNADLSGSMTVGGDLTVNGTTTTVNSTTVTVDDNILQVGGDEVPTSSWTTHDLGIAMPYWDGSGLGSAQTAAILFDDERTGGGNTPGFVFAAKTTTGGTASLDETASIAAKDVKLGNDGSGLVNRSEQWQKVYEELWVNPIGEAALSNEREIPTDLTASEVDKIMMVKAVGESYKYQMTNIIDGGTY